MIEKVLFTAMENGTQSGHDLVNAHYAKCTELKANRVLAWLEAMYGDWSYQISRLNYCLQTPTLATNTTTMNTTRPAPSSVIIRISRLST